MIKLAFYSSLIALAALGIAYCFNMEAGIQAKKARVSSQGKALGAPQTLQNAKGYEDLLSNGADKEVVESNLPIVNVQPLNDPIQINETRVYEY